MLVDACAAEVVEQLAGRDEKDGAGRGDLVFSEFFSFW